MLREALRDAREARGVEVSGLVLALRRPGLHTVRGREKFRAVNTLLRDISARGVRVRLLEAKTDETPAGAPALLLLHDLFSGRSSWSPLLPLVVQTYRVLAPDLPGFGESEKPPPSRFSYSVDAMAEAMLDVLAALRESRAVVCGHGLGAAVALALAADHPGVVKNLILVSPLWHGTKPSRVARLARVPVLGPLVFKQGYGRAMFRAHFRDEVYGRADAAGGTPFPQARVDEWFERFDAPPAREAALATMRGLSDPRAVVARLPRVTTPTLLVWGREDKLVPVSAGRKLAREIPHARLEVLAAGHSPAEEAPEEFARVLRGFIESTRLSDSGSATRVKARGAGGRASGGPG